MAKYKDDSFSVIKSDIERLRKKTTMYISNKGTKGAIHLAKEVINNGIDEALSELSPCDALEIIYDENQNQLTCIDNGRGIPFDQVEQVCTYLHSGSNIDKANEKDNAAEIAGENGVGLTAVNALSKKFYFVIRRDGKKGIFNFEDAKMQEPVYEKCDPKEHGTAVVFIPSEEYLGKCKIDVKALQEWVNDISYTVPSKLKITFSYIKKGKEVPTSTKFSHPKGIEELIKEMAPKTLIRPIHITQEKSRFVDKKTHSDLVITIGDEDITDATNIKSYCNRVITIDGGTHVNAAKNAWCKAVMHMANDLMSDSDKNKYKLTYEDCRVGLTFVMVLNTPTPGFTGQTKQKVDNDELYRPLVDNIYKDLIAYFKKSPNEIKKIISLAKSMAKNRLQVTNVRRSDYRAYDNFEAATSDLFIQCSSKTYRELWIMEGNSALGGFKRVRDPKHQAGFKLKGNPLNTLNCTLAEVMQNAEFRELTKHLGCELGKDFRLSKLKFDKIIIFVDSDIDGWNMLSLLCVYFLKCIPEVVLAGKVYRAMGPLYIMKDNKNPYLLSKSEYYELFADMVCKNMVLINSKGHELSQKELKKLITLNKDYYDELLPIVHYYTTNNEIIEFALVHKDDPYFGKHLIDKFPELQYDPHMNVIEGTYDMADQYLEIGESFYERCTRLTDLIKGVNDNDIYYTMIDKGVKYPKTISLGSFFLMNTKYMPGVAKRVKGVGELPPDVLWKTTLNPEKRELIRLTISDLKQELETVKVLHGKDVALRKDFMADYVFKREDLDT